MSLELIQKKQDEMARAFEDFKKSNDERLVEIQKKGHADPLVVEKVEKANSDMTRLEKEIGEMKTAMARMAAVTTEPQNTQEKNAREVVARKAAFEKLLRKGEQALTAEELKTLMVSDDSQGGYLVPAEMETEILRNLANINGVRALADVRTISKGNSIEQPRRTAGISASWSSENGSNPSAVTPTLGMLRIAAEEMRVLVKATAQMLEDSALNVDAFVQDEAVEAFANLEGDAFIDGSGTGKPMGMLSYASGTSDGQVEQVVSGSAATIADADGGANGFMTLAFKLKGAYAKNSTWLLNRATVGSVRKLKDTNKQYLWAPGIGGAPSTILDRPYVEDDNMPVEGAGNLVAVLADFKKFYKIVDKVGLAITRDPFSSKPMVEFLFRRRVGGAVEIFEAGKILKCST